MEKIVYVASTSEVKLKAVRNVMGEEVTVVGISIPTTVPAQPIGYDQTHQGVMERLAGLAREVGDRPYTWLIAIENGVVETWEEPRRLFDIGLVAMQSFGSSESWVMCTCHVFVPHEALAWIRHSGQTKTIGEFMQQFHGAADPQEWHTEWDIPKNRSRCRLLFEAMEFIIEQE